ncbi:MAG: hypothetical protein HUJ68_12930 [Clostridia bacterium]|nr:hypothetical protein [Clostridia bacterium]
MAEEAVKKDNTSNVPKRLLKTPKVYSKSTATPEQIEVAKQEYIKCVTNAYTKYSKKVISEIKYKELLHTYKVDFDLSTKGKRYLKIIQLHNKGKVIKSTKLFDFGCFALYKEKTQKLSSHAKEYAILKAKAKAIKYNAVYLSDNLEIDKQKNNLKETKLQLKYDITQHKIDGSSPEVIAQAKKEATDRINDIKLSIAQLKQRNKDFYKTIKIKRIQLKLDAKKQYETTKQQLVAELDEFKKIKTSTIIDNINKNEKIRHGRSVLKEVKDTYKYNLFVAKNYHPA